MTKVHLSTVRLPAATRRRPDAAHPARAASLSSTANPDALRAWLAVVRAYNLCDALLARRLAVLRVRTPEHEILANLLREPGITQQALAERCFSAKSHISALLVSMEARKWVKRQADPLDARVKRLYLAAAGARMAAKTAAIQAEVVAHMAQAMTVDELAAVNGVMDRVSQRLLAQ